jgi:hypothetical protein
VATSQAVQQSVLTWNFKTRCLPASTFSLSTRCLPSIPLCGRCCPLRQFRAHICLVPRN